MCGPHEEITKKLKGEFQEAVAGLGLAGNGGLVELFISEKGTWTMTLTRPDGMSCLIAAGDNWEAVEPVFMSSKDTL